MWRGSECTQLTGFSFRLLFMTVRHDLSISTSFIGIRHSAVGISLLSFTVTWSGNVLLAPCTGCCTGSSNRSWFISLGRLALRIVSFCEVCPSAAVNIGGFTTSISLDSLRSVPQIGVSTGFPYRPLTISQLDFLSVVLPFTETGYPAIPLPPPPPGSWGRVTLLIRGLDPLPRISLRFPIDVGPSPS